MKEDQILYMLTSLPGNWYPLKLSKWLKLKTIRFNGQDVGGYRTNQKNMGSHKITPTNSTGRIWTKKLRSLK